MITHKPRVPIGEILVYGFLPSPLKVWLYRLRGYRVGKGVKIGFGSIVSGVDVVIGDHVKIGFLSIIRGKKIHLGPYVQIGSTSFLDTPNLELGEATRVNEQVFVGGLQFPDSKLKVGRHCLIQQMAFINPSPAVTIGDETGIGGHSSVFGHASWQNCFEGYPVQFSPIEIGNHVGIGWRCFILPGSKIGDGTMIGANSVVNRTIPPRCLAVGFPVRIVSKAPDFPKAMSDEEKVRLLRHIVDEMIAHFVSSDIACESCGDNCFKVVYNRKKFLRRTKVHRQFAVRYKRLTEEEKIPLPPESVFVSLFSVPPSVIARLAAQGVMWLDIESKARSAAGNPLCEEIAGYLHRYGVRFFRKAPTAS